VREDVALELGRLDLGGDLGALLGRGDVAFLEVRDRGIDPRQVVVVALRLLSLRHRTPSPTSKSG
jgi:hypothetical protein